ncbi:MAG: hypothetical protein ACTSR3_13895 [Candidatus Helarchaeota archaeon]
MICSNCKELKKNIHICEFKKMKIICDDCCKLIQAKNQCNIRGCGQRIIEKKY